MSLADTITNLDFAKILPMIKLALKFIPGDADDKAFAKVEPTLYDAARFFNAHKDQLKPLLAGIGLIAALFRHNETNRNQPGEPSQPPVLPPVPPIVVPPTVPPTVNPNQVTSMDAGVLFIEKIRPDDGGDADDVIVELPRYRQIVNADGTDAVMINERVHLNFTPKNAANTEIARETIRAIPGNADGSPAFKIEYDVRDAEGEWIPNQDSKGEEDCFGLESQNAPGHGRDTDNGCTPTLKLVRGHEGRARARARLRLPASANYGREVVSPWAEFWVN